jgi:hypothetical protein
MHGPPVDGDLIQQSSTGPFIEHSRPGTPHRGKVPAAIQPHSDDVALLCAGTVAKLIQEGYTGYMIRATNDDMGDDVGEPGTVGKCPAQRTRGDLPERMRRRRWCCFRSSEPLTGAF